MPLQVFTPRRIWLEGWWSPHCDVSHMVTATRPKIVFLLNVYTTCTKQDIISTERGKSGKKKNQHIAQGLKVLRKTFSNTRHSAFT